jgi:hypothetical protein
MWEKYIDFCGLFVDIFQILSLKFLNCLLILQLLQMGGKKKSECSENGIMG